MAIEIEVKLSLDDPAALHAKLAELGAAHDRDVLEANTYFDRPGGDLKNSDQALRIRVEIDQQSGKSEAILTHKGPRDRGEIKSRSETEFTVSDAQAASQMLSALGYRPVLSFEKRRTRYLLDGCKIELDTLPYLGHFVEIEGHNNDEILSAQAKLGLGDLPLVQDSYIALLVAYLSDNQLTPTLVRLNDDPKNAAVMMDG